MRFLLPKLPIASTSSLVLVATLFSSCSGCRQSKSARGAQSASRPSPPAPEPAAPSPVIPDKAVGEDVPPIQPDTVLTIDTSKGAALKHLVFETTGNLESTRYLSEYVVVVHAKEASCVRLKVRPTAGLASKVDDAAASGAEGDAACAAEGTDAPKTEPSPSPTPSPTPSTAASLRGTSSGSLSGDVFNVIDPNDASRRGLSLTSQSAAICSGRLFRMEANSGLGKISTKTGHLLAVGDKVRIWLDAEYANPCAGGTTLDGRTATSFGPLVQNYQFPITEGDKLWTAQLQNLASEMDKIYASLTGTYGPVSDVDANNFVEIFLSPDVNRNYFIQFETAEPDFFRASPIYRPQDLTYYDTEKNPLSNEGEILYLWTPDPAGIYNGVQYPSSDSVTSNYAKGYLASQLMTLVIANQRLLQQKQKNIPDPWLIQSLALLASAYYAGNDYTVMNLAQYMTARHQYVSLENGIDEKLISKPYVPMAHDEELGMRAMFGWYLHARLCGSSVTPCAKLKDLVTSTKQGEEALTALLSDTFDVLMENFALSVAVSLLEKPASALAVWAQTPLPSGLPKAPTTLPDLQEVRTSDPPITAEEQHSKPSTCITESGTSPCIQDDMTDRSQAGPFPSKKMLMFQALASDNDMEFKITKNAVAFILITGLIDPKTDVTAYLGKGLNVVFMPAGERDSSKRRIHYEKVSEDAHSDLRAENLTDTAVADSTYSSDPVYGSVDYSVTPARELWSLGSIDNYDVNVDGQATATGDSDAYAIAIEPCDGLSGAALTACQAKNHQVLIQVYTRDYTKELLPMLMVTTPDRTIFRGGSVYGRMTDLIPTWTDAKNEKTYLCEAVSGGGSGTTVTFTAGTPGVVNAANHGLQAGALVSFSASDGLLPLGILPLTDYVVTSPTTNTFRLKDSFGQDVNISLPSYALTGTFSMTGSVNLCNNGGMPGRYFYDHKLTQADPTAFAHTYGNYLQSGILGFPFTTQEQSQRVDKDPCTEYRCYSPEDYVREHLIFSLKKTVTPITYRFYSTGIQYVFPELGGKYDPPKFNDVNPKTLTFLKNEMDTCSVADRSTDVAFMAACSPIKGMTPTLCAQICGSQHPGSIAAINAAILGNNNDGSYFCTGGSCASILPLATGGMYSGVWVPTSNIFSLRPGSQWFRTFYLPIEPASQLSYCSGSPGHGTTQVTTCPTRAVDLGVSDIRQQLYLSRSDLREGGNCQHDLLGTDFKACIDYISWDREINPTRPYSFQFIGQVLSTDRDHVTAHPLSRDMAIAVRAGEVIAKPERIGAVWFDVPGTGAVVNAVVGGRQMSQGKYMLRARIVNFK